MSTRTLGGWENDERIPGPRSWRAVTAFLGYDPETGEHTFAEKLKALRRRRGWRQKELAEALGISERQLGFWERGLPVERMRRRVGELVEELLSEGPSR